MSEGTSRNVLDGIALCFSSELVAVKGDDEEILDVDAESLAVSSPERSDIVQQERQSIHTEFPYLLVLVLVAFLQRNNVGQLKLDKRLIHT